MKIYLVSQNGQQSGPFTLDELRAHLQAGRFHPGDHAWWEGASGWVRLDAVPELGLSPAPAVPPPPAPPLNVRMSGAAIASLVFGLLALVTGVSGLVGLPLGILALIRIRNGRGELTGSGLAIAGIACSSVGLLGVLLVLLVTLPGLASAKNKAARIKCVNNLKQVGLAFRVFANDNDDLFPWQTNRFPVATANLPWQHFAVMSNELGSAKILICPGDRARLAFQSTDFSTAPGSGLLDRKNSAVSYTVGVNATEALPQVPLSHDRNVGHAPGGSLKIPGYAEGRQEVHPQAYWVQGAKGDAAHHDQAGNMALADGSVMQQSAAGFQEQLRRGAESARRPTISMLFP